MATPEVPRDDLVKYLHELERRLAAVERKDPFINSGVSIPGAGVTQVDGALNILGNLGVQGASTVSGSGGIQSSNFVHGSTGWDLTGTQVEINTGAIGNSAIVHPIAFDGNGGAMTNFALGTSSATILGSVSNTVPAGMTKMASFVVGNVTAVNSTASMDYLECRVGIVDPSSVNYTGNSMYQETPAGTGGHVGASKYGILTGLSGGQTVQHYISAWASSAAWAANASNIADLQAIILWGA